MKKFLKALLKVLKWAGVLLLSLIIILLIVRFIGKLHYNKTPDGGINETMYIDVNGQEQWLNIYGEDINNPVLLYLHGGPGCSTSFADWKVLRKLAGDYTVVNWDQRNSGLTRIHDTQDTEITPELMRQDIDAVTEYILDYMHIDSLTIIGMSWGTKYGADLAVRHPEKVDCLICLSLATDEYADNYIDQAILDYTEGRIDFRTAIDTYGYELFLFYDPYKATQDIALHKKFYEGNKLAWLELTENDEEYRALLDNYDPLAYVEYYHDQSNKELEKKAIAAGRIEEKLGKQYGYDLFGGSFDGADISPAAAIFFNPYYSISDWARFRYSGYDDVTGDRILSDFSMSEITEFEMPFYVLQGDKDSHCGADRKYVEQVNAPDKAFRTVKGGHMATITRSEELAAFIHEIREKQVR